MAEIVDDSILTSVKAALGIVDSYDYFDSQLVDWINTVFSILSQLGVDPDSGFCISDKTTMWSEYLDNNKLLLIVKSYVFKKVKLMFDPPQNSFSVESLNKEIQELEWRINIAVGG